MYPYHKRRGVVRHTLNIHPKEEMINLNKTLNRNSPNRKIVLEKNIYFET